MPIIGNPIYQSAFVTDTFSGNGSTTAFTMSVAPAGTTNVLVVVSGVVQDPSTYGVVGTTLTFSAAPPTGTGNISCRYLGVPVTGITTTAYRTKTEFTATSGQTTFTPPSYTVGYIDVFRNGVLLGSADYTASNGTTVVLAAGATAGDLITTESFYVSSVLNAIPNVPASVGSSNISAGAVLQTNLGSNVAGNGPAFSAYQSSAQTLSSGTWTKIQFQTKEFDTNSNFDNVTNYRFTPTVAGYYQISGGFQVSSSATPVRLAIYKNGSVFKYLGITDSSSLSGIYSSALIYLNGSTDYIELYGYVGTGQALLSNSTATYFQASMVRSQ
jgi:hypothetical protein